MVQPQPWKSADATSHINRLGRDGTLDLSYTLHVRDRLAERDLLVGDLVFILRHGLVYDEPVAATQPGLFKYKVETRTPNSNNRVVRAVVIPDPARCWIKVVTIMWADE